MRKLYQWAIAMSLASFVLLLYGCNEPLSTKNMKCYGRLVEFRELAKNAVKRARESILGHSGLNKAQMLYEKTAAKGNALLGSMQMAVTNRKPSTDFDSDIKAVENTLNEFTEYISSQVNYKLNAALMTKSVSIEVNGKTVGGVDISDAVIKIIQTIWDNAQKAQEKRIAEVKEEMDKNRWLAWNDIK